MERGGGELLLEACQSSVHFLGLCPGAQRLYGNGHHLTSQHVGSFLLFVVDDRCSS